MAKQAVYWKIAFALFLCLSVSLASAHGTEGANDHHAAMEESRPTQVYYAPTYFAHHEHLGFIYGHIVLSVLSWVVVLPIAVMLSIARSRYTLLTQIVFLILNTISVLLAIVYNRKTPDLYPNNAHHKIGWIITCVACAHVSVGLIGRLARFFNRASISNSNSDEREAFLSTSSTHLPQETPYDTSHARRQSDEEGHSSSPIADSFRSSSFSTMCDEDEESLNNFKDYSHDNPLGDHRSTANGARHLLQPLGIASSLAWNCITALYNVTDRVILPFGFVALTTGIVTYARLFEGHEVFSGLAHWIKGGVFFWLGMFNLGRWSGCFAELGWAWNLRPHQPQQQKPRWWPSAEFVESALILFYGSTNIFLEHLGASDGDWSPQDLEHMSITILFIGGGLCGILIESSTVRNLLNTTVYEAASNNAALEEEGYEIKEPESYEFSLNPIPALVILLLGIMMSSHEQSTMISSMVHKQWGNLLLGASFARGLTYVLIFLRPPKSILPSRPPTELLSSFGLMAGGIIFMASSSDTIEGMIHYKLDAMFLYTVTMGFVAMLMAWELIVLAIKGAALRKEKPNLNGI